MPDGSPPTPATTTGYDLPSLAAAYGARPLRAGAFDVDEETYESVAAEQQAGELGGARVLCVTPPSGPRCWFRTAGSTAGTSPAARRSCSPSVTSHGEAGQKIKM